MRLKMDNQQFIYGLEATDTDGIIKTFMFKCDKELDLVARDELCTKMADLLGVSWSDVADALFLYENTDGSPAQQSDLYEPVGSPMSQEERMANLQRLQEEAEEECANG